MATLANAVCFSSDKLYTNAEARPHIDIRPELIRYRARESGLVRQVGPPPPLRLISVPA